MFNNIVTCKQEGNNLATVSPSSRNFGLKGGDLYGYFESFVNSGTVKQRIPDNGNQIDHKKRPPEKVLTRRRSKH